MTRWHGSAADSPPLIKYEAQDKRAVFKMFKALVFHCTFMVLSHVLSQCFRAVNIWPNCFCGAFVVFGRTCDNFVGASLLKSAHRPLSRSFRDGGRQLGLRNAFAHLSGAAFELLALASCPSEAPCRRVVNAAQICSFSWATSQNLEFSEGRNQALEKQPIVCQAS